MISSVNLLQCHGRILELLISPNFFCHARKGLYLNGSILSSLIFSSSRRHSPIRLKHNSGTPQLQETFSLCMRLNASSEVLLDSDGCRFNRAVVSSAMPCSNLSLQHNACLPLESETPSDHLHLPLSSESALNHRCSTTKVLIGSPCYVVSYFCLDNNRRRLLEEIFGGTHMTAIGALDLDRCLLTFQIKSHLVAAITWLDYERRWL